MDFNLGFGQVKVVKTQPYYLPKNLNIVTFISYLSYIRLLHVNYMDYVELCYWHNSLHLIEEIVAK